jgi:hypothetical protein
MVPALSATRSNFASHDASLPMAGSRANSMADTENHVIPPIPWIPRNVFVEFPNLVCSPLFLPSLLSAFYMLVRRYAKSTLRPPTSSSLGRRTPLILQENDGLDSSDAAWRVSHLPPPLLSTFELLSNSAENLSLSTHIKPTAKPTLAAKPTVFGRHPTSTSLRASSFPVTVPRHMQGGAEGVLSGSQWRA